jgi:hypothetical protein
MATRNFPWTTSQAVDSTARTDATTGITNAATALVEGKKKILYFEDVSLAGLTDDGSVVIGVLPIAITNIVSATLRVMTTGVGAVSVDLDITKADGTTALITTPVADGNADAADTVVSLGAGTVADSAGNLIKLRGNFASAVTSGAIYDVQIEVTK